MAFTLDDLVPEVIDRLDEVNPPIFWSLAGEVLPSLVDAMYEASLLTGIIQANAVPVTLAANTTYFNLQNNTAIGIPAGVVAAMRISAAATIRKVTMKGLEDMNPGWQNTPPSNQINAWFPLGVSMFGIWPQLNAESVVSMDFVVSPCLVARPYTAAVAVPFPEQFISAFAEYASGMLRMKEAGQDAEESDITMTSYLAKMKELSMYEGRLDSLVFSTARAVVSPRKEV